MIKIKVIINICELNIYAYNGKSSKIYFNFYNYFYNKKYIFIISFL